MEPKYDGEPIVDSNNAAAMRELIQETDYEPFGAMDYVCNIDGQLFDVAWAPTDAQADFWSVRDVEANAVRFATSGARDAAKP